MVEILKFVCSTQICHQMSHQCKIHFFLISPIGSPEIINEGMSFGKLFTKCLYERENYRLMADCVYVVPHHGYPKWHMVEVSFICISIQYRHVRKNVTIVLRWQCKSRVAAASGRARDKLNTRAFLTMQHQFFGSTMYFNISSYHMPSTICLYPFILINRSL